MAMTERLLKLAAVIEKIGDSKSTLLWIGAQK
jgi:hypothetical protein